MSELKQRITEDMKAAMKGGDKPRLGVIRLILAALKQREVDERITLTDADVLQALEKMLKQRRDSVAQYEAAKREDLAAQERFEIGVIEGYLPAQLSDAELDALIARCLADAGATSPRDMGKVMALLKERSAGRADMGVLSQRVKARLAGHS
ncbi:MAG: GatB/YqeY domain-containing protein [Rhodanobacteraceae bacterium]